jgi:alpha-tubulin suppressor-like RCC1 family protein
VPTLPPLGATDSFKFTKIAAGGNSSYALANDGYAYAWGNNQNGELGNGSVGGQVLIPTRAQNPAGSDANFHFTAIFGGANRAFAIGNDDKLYAWGQNSNGQLGNGSTSSSPTPVPVSEPIGAPAGFKYTIVDSAGTASFALGNNGKLYSWGPNTTGLLGDGTTTSSTTPVTVMNPAGVPASFRYVDVDGSSSGSAYALGNDGNIYAWGSNINGELGNGTNTNSIIPVKVNTPVGAAASFAFTSMSAGSGNVAAIGNNGILYGWGTRTGDKSVVARNSPVRVATPIDTSPDFRFTQLGEMFGNAMFAMGNDGLLYAWGDGSDGALGNGDTINFSAPVEISSTVRISDVSLGGVHAGLGLSQSMGKWSIVTPALGTVSQLCGPVDVAVTWRQLQYPSQTDYYPNAFTYGAAPVINSQPLSQTITAGGLFAASVAVGGDDTPKIQWQSSADGVSGWSDIKGANDTTLIAKPTRTTWYRATVSNCWGPAAAVTSDAAIARVNPTRSVEQPGNTPTGQLTTTVLLPTVTLPVVTLPNGPQQPPATPAQEGLSAVAVAATECSPKGLALMTVFQQHGKALLSGAADERYIGKRLSVYGAFSKKKLGSAVVKSDGLFQTQVALPPKAIRNSNRARYYLKYGATKTSALKLKRRVLSNLPSLRSANKVQLRGRVLGPWAKAHKSVTIERRVSCRKWVKTRTVKLSSDGHFSASFSAPKDAKAVVYRARASVPRVDGGKRLSASFGVFRYVRLK